MSTQTPAQTPAPPMPHHRHRETLAACLCGSALVLAGLLLVQLGGRLGVTDANAGMAHATPGLTLVSASVSDDEEGMFVIDNATGILLIYHLSNNDEVMELGNSIRLDRLFAAAGDGELELDERDRGDRPRRQRN